MTQHNVRLDNTVLLRHIKTLLLIYKKNKIKNMLQFQLPEVCGPVLNGVVIKLFGVETTSRFGVTPLKSDSCSGVFNPPFRGVSTFDKAIIFCAS